VVKRQIGRPLSLAREKKRRDGSEERATTIRIMRSTQLASVYLDVALSLFVSVYSFKGTPVSVPIELVAGAPGYEQLLRRPACMPCWYAWVSDVDAPSEFRQTRSRKRKEGKGNAPPPVDHQ